MRSSTESERTLQSQVAFVTGGGRGVGRAIALALGRAGALVAVVARTERELAETVALVESEGGQARAWSADVTDEARIESVVAEVEDELGPITLLVNNAGRAASSGPLWELDSEAWWRDVEINVRGPMICSRAVLRRMVPRTRGRIVNVASAAATRPTPYGTAYGCSKAALLQFTDSLAELVADRGLQVFAISPGWVWTDMTERTVEVFEEHNPEFDGIPEDQVHAPEEGAELVVRLATGEADGLSGRFIHVDHDMDALLAEQEKIRREDLHALRMSFLPEGEESE